MELQEPQSIMYRCSRCQKDTVDGKFLADKKLCYTCYHRLEWSLAR